jgi:hypothetical protein
MIYGKAKIKGKMKKIKNQNPKDFFPISIFINILLYGIEIYRIYQYCHKNATSTNHADFKINLRFAWFGILYIIFKMVYITLKTRFLCI